MSDCRSIDSLVTPYIDGELADADRRDLENHLGKCPPCYSRVAAERAIRETLCARRRELVANAAPPALRAACQRLCGHQSLVAGHQSPVVSRQSPVASRESNESTRAAWKTHLVPIALAASLVIVVGAAVVYQLTEMSATVLAAELTADHVKCFTLNAALGTRRTPTAVEAAMLGFGWKVHLPDNPAQVGLELVGSRTCLDGQGTIAHLMYKHDGHPLSVFMLPKSTRAERLIGVLGHEAKMWCAGGRTFVLVSSEPRHEVEQLAQFVQTSLH
jgi:anti-sigma factor RsiW